MKSIRKSIKPGWAAWVIAPIVAVTILPAAVIGILLLVAVMLAGIAAAALLLVAALPILAGIAFVRRRRGLPLWDDLYADEDPT